MSPQRATRRRWMVQRRFEPDRLSSATLVQAYAHLVPFHIRVLRLPLPASEAADTTPEPRPIPLNDPAGSKIVDLTEAQPEDLVIGSITKQEAC